MPAWIVPAAIAVGQLIGNLIGQKKQNSANSKLAAYQADMNQKYQDAQNAYNTPKLQMQRFGDAGLNPNLIYGQGNPGNQSSPLQYPEIGKTDYQSAIAQLTPQFNQSLMTQSQVQALDAKTTQTTVLTELNRLQTEVLKKNPLLDKDGFSAIIDSLKSTAAIKATETKMVASQLEVQQNSAQHQVNKIFNEVELLEQRFKLAQADGPIKAQILRSMEFKNAILEIQKNFISEVGVTPQHIFQFIQMLLLKIL